MLDILSRYGPDIVSAFWMTIQLTLWSALGSLVLGTILAVMRVSPVRTLQVLGSLYVFSLIGLLTKLLTDIAYTWVDPRVKFSGHG